MKNNGHPMKNNGHKDKQRYRNKIRKQQITIMNRNKVPAEDDCRVSDESLDWLKGKIIDMSGGADLELVRDSSLEKISDRLLEYAKPFLDIVGPGNIQKCEKAIQISILFWNCAIFQDDTKSRKEILEMLKPVMPDAESKSVANYMIDRKQQMYPDDKRIIVNYKLSETAGGYRLTVAPALIGAEAEKYIKDHSM